MAVNGTGTDQMNTQVANPLVKVAYGKGKKKKKKKNRLLDLMLGRKT